MASRLNFGTGSIVNPLEGLQTAIGDISKQYMQKVALNEAKEEREARAAEDLRRFDLQQSRLDTQEAWQRQKYDEDKARQERLDTIAAEDRTWNKNRQITADERADLLFKQGQQELKEKQATKAADKALQEGFFGLVDKAVLGTSAGVEAQTELARRAGKETQNLQAKDEAVFGSDAVSAYRAPNVGNITEYGKDVAIGAAKPGADRAELVRAMNKNLVGTSTSPTELVSALDKLQLGTDTEAVRAAQAKSASDLAKRIAFGSDGNNITVNSSTGEVTRTGTSTSNKLTSGFVPDKLASSDDWGYVPFAESTATNIAKTQIEAGVKNMTAAEQSRMTQLMVEQGYLKPKEGSLVEDKSLGPKEFNVLLQKAKQELSDKPELQDPVTRYKEIYNRLLKDSQKDVVSDRVSAVLGRGVNSYADYTTTPTRGNLNVSGSTDSKETKKEVPNAELKAEVPDTEITSFKALQDYVNNPSKGPSKEALLEAAQIARDRGVSDKNIGYMVERGDINALLDRAASRGNRVSNALYGTNQAINNIGMAGLEGLKYTGAGLYGLVAPVFTDASIGQATKEANKYLGTDKTRKDLIAGDKAFKDRFISKEELLSSYGLKLPEPSQKPSGSFFSSPPLDMTVTTKSLLNIKDPIARQEAFAIAKELKTLDSNSPKAVLLQGQLARLENQ
jgi:hypothetical protein